MVDKRTGFIKLSIDKIIKPGMSLGDVKSMNLGESQFEIAMGNGWNWYNVRNMEVAGLYFMLSFSFYDDKLKQLSIILSNSKFDLSKDWASWSEHAERQNVVIFNTWLEEELGSAREFGWGEVWTDYDEKGGGSSIGIRYKT